MNNADKSQNISNELMRDTVVIIPALNEEESIAHVIKGIPKERICEIIVVDNGSSDRTAEIAKREGALVLKEIRRGYGQACLTGIEKAFELNRENILFIDADFSDDPTDLAKILFELDQGYEFVLGSRNLGRAQKGALLPHARFGNWLATNLVYMIYGGKKFSDLGPMRGIKTKTLKNLDMCDTNFGWTLEMQIKALVYNIKTREISVNYRPRIGKSKISGTLMGSIKAGFIILMTVFKLKRVSS